MLVRHPLLRDTRGANLVEYILCVGLVAIVALAGVRMLGDKTRAKVEAQAACVTSLDCAGNGAAATGPGTTADGRPLVKAEPKFDIDAAKGATYQAAPGKPFIAGNGDGRDIHPSDISQGQIGDCYLMSSLAAVANGNPDIIKNNIKDNGDGTYTVTFYERGIFGTSKVDVKVKGEFPNKDGRWVFAQPGDTNNGQLELWPMIYEKAYAKYKGGDYKKIGKGGRPEDAMTAITGQPGDWHRTRGVIWDMSFSDFAGYFDKNLVVANTRGDGDKGKQVFKDGTLVTNHAYWVEKIDKTNQTVTVRNPWGWNEKPITLTWDQFKQGFDNISTNTRKP